MRAAFAMSAALLLCIFSGQASAAEQCGDPDTLSRLSNDIACKQLVPCIHGGTAILTSANADESAVKLRDFITKLVLGSPPVRRATTELLMRFVVEHQIESYRILPTAFRLEKPKTLKPVDEGGKQECEITFVPDAEKMTVIMRYLTLATAMNASLNSTTPEGIELAKAINRGDVKRVKLTIDELIANANETSKRFAPFQLHYSVTVSGGEKSIQTDDIGDHYLEPH